MQKTRILLFLALMLPAMAARAQESNPAGTPAGKTATNQTTPSGEPREAYDPLGRPYEPIIGWLTPSVNQKVPAAIGEYLGISFNNGVKGNAHTPYGLVPKSRVEVASQAASYLTKESLRKRYFQESVGVQYLLQLEILYFNSGYLTDTIPPSNGKGAPTLKKVFYCHANLTAGLTDVATSKIVLVNNFNLHATPRELKPKPGQTDSVATLQQLYTLCKDQGQRMFTNLVAGAGKITAIKDGSSEKAESVLVNENMLMTASTYGQVFNVYALREEFTDHDQTFTHAEKVGVLSKSKDFNYKERNFEVEKGGKDIAALLTAGKTLLCAKEAIPMRPLLAGGRRPSVLFESFTTKVPIADYRLRIMEDATKEYLIRFPQLLDVVDRETYRLIESERRLQSKTQSAATQAGVSIGAEYVLKAEITELKFSREILETKKVIPGTPAPAAKPAVVAATDNKPNADQKKSKTGTTNPDPTADQKQSKTTGATKTTPPPAEKKPESTVIMVPSGIRAKAFARADVRLVSVKTGEIVWNSNYDARAQRDYPLDKSAAALQRQEEDVLRDVANNFGTQAGPQLFQRLNGKAPILQITESKEGDAKRVLLGGGTYAGFWDGLRFEVIEVSEETIDGQTLQREAPVGELKVVEIFPETAMCKVTEGGAAIQSAFGAKRRLYCRVKA